MKLLLLVALFGRAWAQETSLGNQEIEVRGKAKAPAADPKIPLAAPTRPVVDEVIRSLDVYKTDYSAKLPAVEDAAGPRRGNRPFPGSPFLAMETGQFPFPYDRWVFEVLDGRFVIWSTGDEGKADELVTWDGLDSSGGFAVKTGTPYKFRFTGIKGKESLSVLSKEVVFSSLLLRETLGAARLEVVTETLFMEGKAAISKEGERHLQALCSRLRRVRESVAYRVQVHDLAPKSALSKKRRAALEKFLRAELLASPGRLKVELLPPGERGAVVEVQLPAEEGETILSEP